MPKSWRKAFSTTKSQPSYATNTDWPPIGHSQDVCSVQATAYNGYNDSTNPLDSLGLSNMGSQDGIMMTKDLRMDVEGGSSGTSIKD